MTDQHQLEELALAHSVRFRKVANRYPRVVAAAYGGDIAAAAADNDEEVAARVATWEREHGLEPHDWRAIGDEERGELGGGDDG